MEKPVIGIPIGDPAGIGPEIVVKALSDGELYKECKPLVIGDGSVIRKASEICSPGLRVNSVNAADEGLFQWGSIDLLDLSNIGPKCFETGKIQALGGKASFGYIRKAVELALNHEIDAVATAPINKESLRAAGIEYIGHTEILAGLTGSVDPLTMFEVRNLRIFFLTRHVPLSAVSGMITGERLLDYIKRCTEALDRLGIKEGAMAVAGFNPHSGEHGLFGNEEVDVISPAIEKAKSLGYRVTGPIGADSVFHMALGGRFNSVLSLYHDQGHIAAKTFDFERTISLTIGLPFLRTSVDHGTAFDIAGTGRASALGMIEAIKAAAKYSRSYNPVTIS